MGEFKKGDIIYHDIGEYKFIVKFCHIDHECNHRIEGSHYLNLSNGRSGEIYGNRGIKELRLATEEEKELLYGKFPELKTNSLGTQKQPFQPREMMVSANQTWFEKQFVYGMFKGEYIVRIDGHYKSYQYAKELPKELENGKVYKNTAGNAIVFKTGDKTGFGFNDLGKFEQYDRWTFESEIQCWKEYPLDDFNKLLLEELNKRGFKKGALIKNHQGEFILDELDLNIQYEPNWGFWNRQEKGKWLFLNGKWADIIPTMSKKEAEEKLGVRIV